MDVLVVWDGEDGGPKVRAVAPSAAHRAACLAALESVWDYDHHRDCPYLPRGRGTAPIRGYLPGERRPCATLFEVSVQTPDERVLLGEPANKSVKSNVPDV